MADASESTELKLNTKEPKNRAITQQSLPACKPVLEKTWVIFIFLSIATVLIPIGIVCLVYGLKSVEVSARYDQACLPSLPDNDARQAFLWQNSGNASALTCTIALHIEHDIPGPVYVYYEIIGLYQNHRRYVRSRSDLQLAAADGNWQTNYCDPQEYYMQNKSLPINPCGLIAWSYFNDTYTLELQASGTNTLQPLPVDDKGIAFQADIDHRYANYTPKNFNPIPNQYCGGAQINGTPQQDERFINWMRISALPRFRKLWGKINSDLKAGDIVRVAAVNQYNTYSFDGQKSIVLGNTTWLGGRNVFLGTVFIVTGGLSLLLGLLYTVVVLVKPRKFADLNLIK